VYFIKKRSIGLCILFSLITCGIYTLYWIASMNNQAKKVAGITDGPSGFVVLLLSCITCDIYFYYWCYKMGEFLDRAKERQGITPSKNSILYLLLTIFGLSIVTLPIMQSELNDAIDGICR